VIRPSWVEYEGEPDELVITLDPGMAFGTGYHPTTRMCLTSLEQMVTPGLSVLDLGTGSGILTVAARLLGAGSAVAIDTDPNAVKVARENCRANGMGREVRLVRGTLPLEQAPAESFDLAVGNISGRVIQAKASHTLEALKRGGCFIASGFINDQTPGVIETLQEAGFSDISIEYTDEWACVVSRRL
jgi:ribosomal protein L11 methyltransferase